MFLKDFCNKCVPKKHFLYNYQKLLIKCWKLKKICRQFKFLFKLTTFIQNSCMKLLTKPVTNSNNIELKTNFWVDVNNLKQKSESYITRMCFHKIPFITLIVSSLAIGVRLYIVCIGEFNFKLYNSCYATR